MKFAKLRPLLLSLVVACCAAGTLGAQEEPLTAGGEGVPVPKKTKHVQPVYPAEALAQGIRGIVILDVVIDAQGKVASTSVLRSVPGLDEAAIAAARQWEYEPTKVAGKAVSVRVTVPITFSLALPRLARQAGVPELRQGVAPAFPQGGGATGTAAAEVTLEPDGRIGDARLVAGEAPWSEALLSALKSWRFALPPDDAVVSFRVEAEFVRANGSNPNTVQLKATGLQRSDLMAGAAPLAPAPASSAPAAEAPRPQPAPVPTAPEPATPAAPTPAAPSSPTSGTPPSAPAPAASPAAPAPGPTASPTAPAPAPTTEAKPPASATPTDKAPPDASAAAPPPVDVLTAPPPAQVPESGISAVRDVTLEPGVPELARGRRPVAPPIARLSGSTGAVEVSFSVGAGGNTALQTAAGPDILRYAAEQTVASWVFRRTRADRAYLVAVFTYDPDKASAVVRPQAPSNASPAASDVPTATPPSTTPPSPALQPPPQE